jgi:hypothetical protein
MKKLFSTLAVLAICHNICAGWLVWTQPAAITEQVTQYRIYRVSGHSSSLVGTTTPPTTSFDVTYHVQGSRSVFYVTAVNANGESPASSKITIQRK